MNRLRTSICVLVKESVTNTFLIKRERIKDFTFCIDFDDQSDSKMKELNSFCESEANLFKSNVFFNKTILIETFIDTIDHSLDLNGCFIRVFFVRKEILRGDNFRAVLNQEMSIARFTGEIKKSFRLLATAGLSADSLPSFNKQPPVSFKNSTSVTMS